MDGRTDDAKTIYLQLRRRIKIDEILLRAKCTLKQMQSLIGSLNFACRAIIPGRPFCRRLINSTCGLTKPHHHLSIFAGMRKDLKLWLRFFKDFNGVSVFHDRFWTSNEDLQLFTDSAAGVWSWLWCFLCRQIVLLCLASIMGGFRNHRGHNCA